MSAVEKKYRRPFYSFSDRIKKGEKEDYFFNADDFEWTKKLEQHFSIIRDEILNHVDSGNAEIKPYFAKDMMNLPGKWKTFSFYFWGFEGSDKAIEACPQTVKIFSSIEGITSFSVSIMDPHSEIKPHRGDTDAIYRCHLGIEIPAGLPDCGFYVGYDEKPWQEGKILVFNDAAYHKGWNNTDKRRIVVLFDVIRPQFQGQKIWICSRIIGALLFSLLNQKIKIVQNPDSVLRKMFCFAFAIPMYFILTTGFKKKWIAKILTPG